MQGWQNVVKIPTDSCDRRKSLSVRLQNFDIWLDYRCAWFEIGSDNPLDEIKIKIKTDVAKSWLCDMKIVFFFLIKHI